MTQRLVIVSDSGESWLLGGDPDEAKMASSGEEQHVMPKLLKAGWAAKSMTPGSGTKDDSSYWLVLLEK